MSEGYDYDYIGDYDYCYPNSNVLINRFGIRDHDELSEIERGITYAKLIELQRRPAWNFDFAHLKAIHKYLFEDIYDWAGEIRKGDFLSKGGSTFCRGAYIEESARRIFLELAKDNMLVGMDRPDFVSRFSYYIGEINALHPFREGNGRTQRAFFEQLAENAGYLLNFKDVDAKALLAAEIEAYNTRYNRLSNIVDKLIQKKHTP